MLKINLGKRIIILAGVYFLSSLVNALCFFLYTGFSYGISFYFSACVYAYHWLIIAPLGLPKTLVDCLDLVPFFDILLISAYLIRPNKATLIVSILAIFFWQYLVFWGLFAGV